MELRSQVLVTRCEGMGGIKNETQISCLNNYEEIGAIYGDEEDQPGTEFGGTIRRLALSMLGQSYLGRSGCGVSSKLLTVYFRNS